jgi:hypothetical protein
MSQAIPAAPVNRTENKFDFSDIMKIISAALKTVSEGNAQASGDEKDIKELISFSQLLNHELSCAKTGEKKVSVKEGIDHGIFSADQMQLLEQNSMIMASLGQLLKLISVSDKVIDSEEEITSAKISANNQNNSVPNMTLEAIEKNGHIKNKILNTSEMQIMSTDEINEKPIISGVNGLTDPEALTSGSLIKQEEARIKNQNINSKDLGREEIREQEGMNISDRRKLVEDETGLES